MTGLERAAGVLHPVLVTKIDNTPAGAPQSGVAEADLVVEEPVEGGETRLAAFYQSQLPDRAGPVRSVRDSDIGLVQPADGTLVASGGAAVVLQRIQASGITVISEGAPGFSRDPNRSAPTNLFVDLNTVVGEVTEPPFTGSYLSFGEFSPPAGAPATSVDVKFSNQTITKWKYNSSTQSWERQSTPTVAVNTLLNLHVGMVDAGYKDPAGNPVPVVITSGSGNGSLVVGENIYPITWEKKSDKSRWEIRTDAGLVLAIPAGKTWISLVPAKGGKVTYAAATPAAN